MQQRRLAIWLATERESAPTCGSDGSSCKPIARTPGKEVNEMIERKKPDSDEQPTLDPETLEDLEPDEEDAEALRGGTMAPTGCRGTWPDCGTC